MSSIVVASGKAHSLANEEMLPLTALSIPKHREVPTLIVAGVDAPSITRYEVFMGPVAGRPFPFLYSFHRIHGRDDIRRKIERLRGIEDGWLDGIGKGLNQAGLSHLEEQLVRYYPKDAPKLRLYPTADGSAQAEWWIGDYHAALEVFLDDGAIAEWSDYNLQTRKEMVRDIDTNKEQDWEWVVQRLQILSS